VPFAPLLIGGPLKAGCTLYFLRLARWGTPSIKEAFSGFNAFLRNIALFFLVNIYTVLWSLLLVIPGIVKGLSYSMAWYIINDFPHLSANQAIEASMAMMRGHKMRLFLLNLSFILWYFIPILIFLFFHLPAFFDPFFPVPFFSIPLFSVPFFVLLGITFLFLNPYIETTMANFYQDLKECRASLATEGSDKSSQG
jgi:uncharacterized membrane protein